MSAGLGTIVLIAGTTALILTKRKKGDPELKSIYKKISGTADINEVYNLFNAMIKHCCGISLKASPLSAVRSGLNDANLSDGIADIMDFMESPEARAENGNIILKSKIKGVYKNIANIK